MRAIDLISTNSHKQILLCGGNVFKGQTASIKLEDIEPTLKHYFNELKTVFPKKASIFNNQHFHPLGSVGKKPVSGDIDLGVDASSFLDQKMSDASIAEWGIDPKAVAKDAEAMAKRARTATPAMLRMKAFLKSVASKINAEAPSLHCEESKVTSGNLFGMFPQFNNLNKKLGIAVQIDWMVGDLEWLQFSYYSAAYPAESNVKGLARTQFMLSLFQVANLSFDHVNGVKDKDTGKIVAKRPDEALAILNQRLRTNITKEIAENYYMLHDTVLSSVSPSIYSEVINIFLKILDSTRTAVPDNLRDEWKARKDKLGLTGKFLPDDDPMRQYL